jgi:hypothetical protein
MIASLLPTGGKKNVILGSVAGVLILVAAIIYFSASSSAPTITDASAAETNVVIVCGKCGANEVVNLEEYERRKAARSSQNDMLACAKCGDKSVWQRARSNVLNVEVPDSIKNEGIDLNVQRPPEEGEPEQTKAVTGGALRPN